MAQADQGGRRPTMVAVLLAVIVAVTTGLALLAVAGHTPWTGPRVLAITENHGINAGDVLPIGAWAVVSACCLLLWRRVG